MARTRTTKKLAQRIDLNYFKRPTAFKSAKLWLCVLVPVLALAWIAWRGLARDSRVYSSGTMSEAHAVLGKRCAVCHVQTARAFSSKPSNSACLSCHDGPAHHQNEMQAAVPDCATCHMEHRGRINIRAASNQSCAECHGNLRATGGGTEHYAAHIVSLEDSHPEFAALRDRAEDPGTIALNHALHMKPIRRGPNGPFVLLECADCHRPAAVNANWSYGDSRYIAADASHSNLDEFVQAKSTALKPSRASTGREYMAPVRFATACAGCHLLSFDKRFDEGVPHDKPEVVRGYLVRKFQEYISLHPGELRVTREPKQDLTGRPLPAEIRVLAPAQWVSERAAEAEELCWRKTCKQCHVLRAKEGTSLPVIVSAHITQPWLPHARFDHDAHRGFSCVGCHAKALTSAETSDVLVPGIANCKACHAPGEDHAESRCFECHTYHDWSKRKEVKPQFTPPEFETRGR
jgi:hypothetical protein